MKRAAFVLLLLVSACGDGDRTDCALAKENLDKCNAEIEATTPFLSYRRLPLSIGDDCTGDNACFADCVKGTSCDAIAWVTVGGQTDPEAVLPRDAGTFSGCIQTCIKRSRMP